MALLAGCSAFGGGGSGAGAETGTAVPDEQVAVGNEAAGATDVNQTLRITVDETTAGSEWAEIGATYPRDRFVVDSATHEAITLGVDTDGDGEIDRRFNETHVSGVNNNEFSFDVTLDTGYTLQEGDVIVVGYPAVDNPDDPGEYEVEIRLNGEQTVTGTVTVE
ncbi:hypothetical protein ACFR97_10715 [Haloplanus litoreus]|uniref:Uncharacterized protein n=2 Tax=Haloplanus litoreus TaxID=767515 RepID=A0ABD6A2Z0_9EURY